MKAKWVVLDNIFAGQSVRVMKTRRRGGRGGVVRHTTPFPLHHSVNKNGLNMTHGQLINIVSGRGRK